MRRPVFAVLLLLLLLLPHPASARQGVGVYIESPMGGQPVQGLVPVMGGTDVEGFSKAEVTFGYTGDPTQTWFLIAEMAQPLAAGKLADWDTTTLTDGNYTLRLVVTRVDGSELPAVVENVRVRNYSVIETSTPTITPTSAPQPSATPTLTITPSQTPVPASPTPLPRNPAEVSTGELGEGLARGVAASAAAFAAFGLYLSARRRLRK